ncbi:hypothetical protein BKA82DRAFT_4512578 [Pisolithus tinctorius]|nr:hypothetical protein BKA82DRAFT_4512578 [Pisolithus tinctorius]
MRKGPDAYRRLKHQQVRFSTIDLVHFRMVPDQRTPAVLSPDVIWSSRTRTTVDIEFRESVFRHSAGAELYEPASDLDDTIGFYFKSGDDLCGVTARHVLFPADEDNSDYTYGPSRLRKEVLLMGTKAWDDYLKSVQIRIGHLGTAAEIHKELIRRLEGRAAGDTTVARKAKKELTKTRELLEETISAINELQELYEQTKDFAPHSFTRMDGDRGRQVRKQDVSSHARAVRLQVPSQMPPRAQGHSRRGRRNCLYVIKHGLTTLTTIGRATGCFSYASEYFSNQTHRDSIEWAILPYDSDSGAFSKGGDSGSVIACGTGDFGGLLTGGSGKTESSDVNYATPMFWLWVIIKAKFPNANLYPVFN